MKIVSISKRVPWYTSYGISSEQVLFESIAYALLKVRVYQSKVFDIHRMELVTSRFFLSSSFTLDRAVER